MLERMTARAQHQHDLNLLEQNRQMDQKRKNLHDTNSIRQLYYADIDKIDHICDQLCYFISLKEGAKYILEVNQNLGQYLHILVSFFFF
jgi:hypothetical protein